VISDELHALACELKEVAVPYKKEIAELKAELAVANGLLEKATEFEVGKLTVFYDSDNKAWRVWTKWKSTVSVEGRYGWPTAAEAVAAVVKTNVSQTDTKEISLSVLDSIEFTKVIQPTFKDQNNCYGVAMPTRFASIDNLKRYLTDKLDILSKEHPTIRLFIYNLIEYKDDYATWYLCSLSWRK
jgi:hypothetical protein